MSDLNRLIDSAVNLDDDDLLTLSEGEDRKFSDSYNARMQSLFRRAKPRRRMVSWRYGIASVLIVILLASVATGAFWDEIASFFKDVYVQYIDLRGGPRIDPYPVITDEVLDSWPRYWYPHYLPDQYRFESAKERNEVKQISFLSDAGDKIRFEQMPGEFILGNDNEGTPVLGIIVGNFETYAFEKNVAGTVLNTLAWSDTSTSFRLTGQLSFEELIKIAEHIIYIENTVGG